MNPKKEIKRCEKLKIKDEEALEREGKMTNKMITGPPWGEHVPNPPGRARAREVHGCSA